MCDGKGGVTRYVVVQCTFFFSYFVTIDWSDIMDILIGMELRLRVVTTIITTDHHVYVSNSYFSMSTVYYQFYDI